MSIQALNPQQFKAFSRDVEPWATANSRGHLRLLPSIPESDRRKAGSK